MPTERVEPDDTPRPQPYEEPTLEKREELLLVTEGTVPPVVPVPVPYISE